MTPILCDMPGCEGGQQPSGDVCVWCAGRGSYSLRALGRLLGLSPSTLRRISMDRPVKPETAIRVLDRILKLQRSLSRSPYAEVA